jgi:hypothetical protein
MTVVWIPAYAGMTEYVGLLIANMFGCLIFFLDCFVSLAMTQTSNSVIPAQAGIQKKKNKNVEI